MPVPQRVNFIVGWASCPLRTGKMPVPQRVNFIVGWAGEPAYKRLIENGARSQLLLTL